MNGSFLNFPDKSSLCPEWLTSRRRQEILTITKSVHLAILFLGYLPKTSAAVTCSCLASSAVLFACTLSPSFPQEWEKDFREIAKGYCIRAIFQIGCLYTKKTRIKGTFLVINAVLDVYHTLHNYNSYQEYQTSISSSDNTATLGGSPFPFKDDKSLLGWV